MTEATLKENAALIRLLNGMNGMAAMSMRHMENPYANEMMSITSLAAMFISENGGKGSGDLLSLIDAMRCETAAKLDVLRLIREQGDEDMEISVRVDGERALSPFLASVPQWTEPEEAIDEIMGACLEAGGALGARTVTITAVRLSDGKAHCVTEFCR